MLFTRFFVGQHVVVVRVGVFDQVLLSQRHQFPQ
jgi:hypothetical protein